MIRRRTRPSANLGRVPSVDIHKPGTFRTSDMSVAPDFVGQGYGYVTAAGQVAVAAAEADGIHLETTYTGKAMAALMHDLQQPNYGGEQYLFWNTHNSRELPVTADRPDSLDNIPVEFLRYYE